MSSLLGRHFIWITLAGVTVASGGGGAAWWWYRSQSAPKANPATWTPEDLRRNAPRTAPTTDVQLVQPLPPALNEAEFYGNAMSDGQLAMRRAAAAQGLIGDLAELDPGLPFGDPEQQKKATGGAFFASAPLDTGYLASNLADVQPGGDPIFSGGGGAAVDGLFSSGNNGASSSGLQAFGGGGGGGGGGESGSSGLGGGSSFNHGEGNGDGGYFGGGGGGTVGSGYNPALGGGEGDYLGAIQLNGEVSFITQGDFGHWNNDLYLSTTEATVLTNSTPSTQKVTQFIYATFLGTMFDTAFDFQGGTEDAQWRFNGVVGHGANNRNLIFNAPGSRKIVMAGEHNAWWSHVQITADTEVVIASGVNGVAWENAPSITLNSRVVEGQTGTTTALLMAGNYKLLQEITLADVDGPVQPVAKIGQFNDQRKTSNAEFHGAIKVQEKDYRALQFTADGGSTAAFYGQIFVPNQWGFEKVGDGTVIVSGASANLDGSGSIGEVDVTAGTLVVNASIAAPLNATVIVHPGAQLGGNGYIDGSVRLEGAALGIDGTTQRISYKQAATVAPGRDGQIGNLTVMGNVTFASAGVLKVDLNDIESDVLTVDGVLDLSGQDLLVINIVKAAAATAYVIAEYGSLLGEFDFSSGVPDGYGIDYHYQGLNQIALVLGGGSAAPGAPTNVINTLAASSTTTGGAIGAATSLMLDEQMAEDAATLASSAPLALNLTVETDIDSALTQAVPTPVPGAAGMIALLLTGLSLRRPRHGR